MEILSTGEKIKRTRVYNGITLKELCGNFISISKMSCIENGKVKADETVLKYVSDKLNIDYDYLIEDVYEQIIHNLDLIKNESVPNNDLTVVIKQNLDYAIEYKYFDLAFELTHVLFSTYVEDKKIENLQLIVSKYNDLYQRECNDNNTMVYYKDMGSFFIATEEYTEAINYFKKLLEFSKLKNKTIDPMILLNLGICYKNVGDYLKSYDYLNEAVKNIDNIEDEIDKSTIYHHFVCICIALKKEEAAKYIEIAYNMPKSNPMSIAIAKSQCAKSYFDIGNREKAILNLKESIECFPKHNKVKYVKFLLNIIKTFYDNKEFELSYEYTDLAINVSIETEEITLIEESYYYKGMSLQKMDRYSEAEIYMNLAIDSLFKFAGKEKRYKRYLEMAELYYNLGETREALRYFTLANQLDKYV